MTEAVAGRPSWLARARAWLLPPVGADEEARLAPPSSARTTASSSVSSAWRRRMRTRATCPPSTLSFASARKAVSIPWRSNRSPTRSSPRGRRDGERRRERSPPGHRRVVPRPWPGPGLLLRPSSYRPTSRCRPAARTSLRSCLRRRGRPKPSHGRHPGEAARIRRLRGDCCCVQSVPSHTHVSSTLNQSPRTARGSCQSRRTARPCLRRPRRRLPGVARASAPAASGSSSSRRRPTCRRAAAGSRPPRRRATREPSSMAPAGASRAGGVGARALVCVHVAPSRSPRVVVERAPVVSAEEHEALAHRREDGAREGRGRPAPAAARSTSSRPTTTSRRRGHPRRRGSGRCPGSRPSRRSEGTAATAGDVLAPSSRPSPSRSRVSFSAAVLRRRASARDPRREAPIAAGSGRRPPWARPHRSPRTPQRHSPSYTTSGPSKPVRAAAGRDEHGDGGGAAASCAEVRPMVVTASDRRARKKHAKEPPSRHVGASRQQLPSRPAGEGGTWPRAPPPDRVRGWERLVARLSSASSRWTACGSSGASPSGGPDAQAGAG